MFVQRHDLIAIATPARQQIWQALPACAANWPQNELEKLVLCGYDGVFVPGIVRRQENALPGQLQIGLSAPYRQDGRRLRMAATIPVAAAGARLTPYQAALLPPDKTRRESALYRLLSAVLAVGEELGIPCGCCADGPSGIRMDCGTYAFSLPNGTCLACSFNEELICRLYEMEGAELRKNRIDTLLGPGMNLHRNPLNGRNFEYFSEDPFLTGKIAAAQLKGMHAYGVTGTLKHFAGEPTIPSYRSGLSGSST